MVFASLHPGTQATKRSTSQIKFHTFSLGTWISTSFSNCKEFPPQTQFFLLSEVGRTRNSIRAFPSSASRENGCGLIDRSGKQLMTGQEWAQGKVFKANRVPRLCFLDP